MGSGNIFMVELTLFETAWRQNPTCNQFKEQRTYVMHRDQQINRLTRDYNILLRSGINFAIGSEWFCSVFKLMTGESSEMVDTFRKALVHADTGVELCFESVSSVTRYALECAEFSQFRKITKFGTFWGISRD